MKASEMWDIFSNIFISLLTKLFVMGRDSVVGIATRYGLDVPGTESRRGASFLDPSLPTLGSTQPPVQWVLGLFPGGKAAGVWR
jgi:hypothetical protein